MPKSSDLTASLATVAIASLGGPLAMGDAALKEVVKYAQARYEENQQSRLVRKKITEAITFWARSENFPEEEVERGLELAVKTVAKFGLSNEVLADLRFDPTRAANKVVFSARKKDRYWGTEKHYEVADRAIQVTYGALIGQLLVSHDVLIPLFQVLRAGIDAHATKAMAMAETTHVQLGNLVETLVAPSTVPEVKSYLRTRAADWDVSVWHHDRQAAALERHLRVREQEKSATGGEYLTAEEALAHQQMLVVLGGPGAGKTWLARRYARQAAQTALSQLENGVGLEEVELPLLTTWEQWAKPQSAPPRESLVAASFASGQGHNDPGNDDIDDRLRRTFLQPQARVLLVVDSLDEAADHTAQASRLYELSGLPAGWRVVVTSRPTAWDATYRGSSDQALKPRVVTLCDLTYPEDVQAFIYDWFIQAADPARGEALIREIHDRAELARIAVVPLMLTFYCLLAEDPKAIAEPLPARRRDLYDKLAQRLIHGEWTAVHPGLDAGPDWLSCKKLLMNWAWQAVHNRTNAVGLGVWDDSFTPPSTVPPAERRAIDHIVPKTAVDGERNITRRFVHRTFLEHFVAEHIATLDASEAADLLLPHLWFDPDWKVTAPAAIVAHNLQEPGGTLLQHLLDRAVHSAPDSARQWAYNQLDQLLLSIAQESKPDDWSQEHQDVLHKCRTSSGARNPDLVTRSVHWKRSNQDARTVVLQALPTDPWVAQDLVRALVGLGPTEAERAQARTVVLEALPTADHWSVKNLVGALVGLGPTEAERAQARTVVLEALPTVDSWNVGDLVGVLVGLVPTDAERAQARTVVLDTLPTAHPSGIKNLVWALVGLVTTEAEQSQACTVVLEALYTAHPWIAGDLVGALVKLEPTEAERAETRAVVLEALYTAESWVAGDLVRALVKLEPTEAERAQARTVGLEALYTAESWVAGDLVRALVGLGPTVAERAQARTLVLEALPTADPHFAIDLVRALVGLGPTVAERAQARTVVLEALSTAASWEVGDLVQTLVGLGPTEAEGAQARTVVLEALSTAASWEVGDLVQTLVGLGPTEAERDQARTVVLEALPTADKWDTKSMVEALRTVSSSESWLAWLNGGEADL